jgi:hypothetical protein
MIVLSAVSGARSRPYRIQPGEAGLIFGYSNVSESAIGRGVDKLAKAIAATRAGH